MAGKPEIIELELTSDAYEAIEKLARSTNRQLTTVLRDSIAFERWYWNTRDKGHRVLVDEGRGSFKEIRRPRGPGLTSPPEPQERTTDAATAEQEEMQESMRRNMATAEKEEVRREETDY